jgi:hypothetical protein
MTRSRRDFIKTSASAAAAATLTGWSLDPTFIRIA